jgi:hypothetical protein
MYAFELCRKYQHAINNGQFDRALAFFASNATVTTPIAGTMTAVEYHDQLVRHTKQAIVRLRNIFEGLNSAPSIAMHLHYTWILKTGKVIEFNGVDLYEFTPDRKKFSSLTIIYDSAPVRQHLTKEEIAAITSGRL